jgi:cytochrome c peroxidase
LANEPIAPIPLSTDLNPDKVRLGERLFHEPRLSHNNARTCSDCHQLAEGGDDGESRSLAVDGKPLDFNTPTVFNAALNFRLNWRGNFSTLAAHNENLLHNVRIMNTNWPELLAKLRADPDYREAFAAIYPGDLEPAQVLDAIATFERSLLTPNARFDRYLRGRRDAITEQEKRGYELFKAYGCTACHQGVNVGGNLFQKFGIFQPRFSQRDALTEADLGRFTLTGDQRDRQVFRVPSLRNVAVTPPYFHDGSAQTLENAVEIMARKQLNRALTEEEIGLIVKFLRTLTGEYQGRSLAADGNSLP